MSPNIWTQCEGLSRFRTLECEAWRVVESQYLTSTRKLVDSDSEQEVLEELIDGVKPPVPSGREFEGLHYLLYTPFRHPPLRNGSRFGTRAERGIFYAALEARTAFAEVAYYRLVFLDGTQAELTPLQIELSAFQSLIRAERAVDLTSPPFSEYEQRISSKTRYDASQELGANMRAARVQAFLYRSARDAEGGTCLGLFEPAFGRDKPKPPESWSCVLTRQRVEFAKKDVFRVQRLAFDRAQFEVGGVLPAPAL